MGIGVTKEVFQSEGRTLVQSEELKIMERGTEIDRALELSIFAEMESGPVDVSEGMLERSWETL